jgi:uncharacterized membrane protein
MKLNHKIYFIIATLLALASWVVAIYYWDKLPQTIPIHFGISGQADDWANKSIFYVFLIPFLQSLILGMFVFLYYKPQYSDIPTTMWLMTLDKKHRDHAFSLIRTMIIGMSLWIGVLFTYITYGMNASALDSDSGLSTPIMFIIIGLMIVWLIFWTVKVYRATKEVMKSIRKS